MLNLLDKMYIKAKCAFSSFVREEDGDVNIVSIVVLIGIAVILALAFKDQIVKLLSSIFGQIDESSKKIKETVDLSGK